MECRAPQLGTFGDLNKLLQLGHQSEPPAVKAVCTQKVMALIVHTYIHYYKYVRAQLMRVRDNTKSPHLTGWKPSGETPPECSCILPCQLAGMAIYMDI